MNCPPDLLVRFQAYAPRFIVETAIARIWRVDTVHGPAALKHYPRGMRGEAPGFRLLRRLAGAGVARLYAADETAALLEWLPGPALGDLSRAGQDRAATQALLHVARRLHRDPLPDEAYPTLETWFDALWSLRTVAGSPAAHPIGQATALARDLVATQRDIRPLHGDLHHDNIHWDGTAWRAFDAKGVLGERAYELANALRNPKGADAVMRAPERIDHLADVWAAGFALDRTRLLRWAAAKAALSIAWSGSTPLAEHPELDLLEQLLDRAAAA